MSAPIRIAIRADAGATLGTGHFARAAAVAAALMAGEACDVVLVTDEVGAALVPAYFPAAIRLVTLAAGAATPADALQAVSAAGWSPEAVYVDQYGDVPVWEALAQARDFRLLVLDDLDAASIADVIVRPHNGDDAPSDRIVLRGPAFLPLSSHIIAAAGRERPLAEGGRLRLNVCFGGSDPTGETGKAVQALAALNMLDADVVIGPGARIEDALIAAAARLPHVTIHRAPSQEKIAQLMSEADFALGAGGVMLWERLCLGIPSLVVQTAENQRPQIDTMAAAGAIRFIGDHATVSPATMVAAIAEIADDDTARTALSSKGTSLVDGRGALRLAAWVRALALSVREVQPADAEDLLAWRTDPRNWRHNWAGDEKPALAAHIAWLDTRLADPDCVFRVITRGHEPVGVVRFDIGGDGRSAYLSIYLVPAWHGRGMGLAVYLAAERALRLSRPGVREIVSRIGRENGASVKLHRDAGFALAPSPDRANWLDAIKTID